MKKFLKMFGIIALTAIVGFSMAACIWDPPHTGNVGAGVGDAIIIVSNDAPPTMFDVNISVYISEKGSSEDKYDRLNISQGKKATIRVDEGDYRIGVTDNLGISYFFPSYSSTVQFGKGTTELSYDGYKIVFKKFTPASNSPATGTLKVINNSEFGDILDDDITSVTVRVTNASGDEAGTSGKIAVGKEWSKPLSPGTYHLTFVFDLIPEQTLGDVVITRGTVTKVIYDGYDVFVENISDIFVNSVTINKDVTTLIYGGSTANTEQLTATVLPDNATNKTVTWTSSNTGVATVNSSTGLVTAVGVGTADIIAIAGSAKSAPCVVTVKSFRGTLKITNASNLAAADTISSVTVKILNEYGNPAATISNIVKGDYKTTTLDPGAYYLTFNYDLGPAENLGNVIITSGNTTVVVYDGTEVKVSP